MGRRTNVRRKPVVTSNQSSGYGVLPANFRPILDEIDRQAMNEGRAMRQIPSWRKKLNEI